MKKEMNHIATLVRRGISLRLGMAALTAVLCLASCFRRMDRCTTVARPSA